MSKPNMADQLPLPPQFAMALKRVTTELTTRLGDNLFSLILYGSAVRGSIDPASSDLNLLIVLEVSSAEAHDVISRLICQPVPIEPMIISRHAMTRAKHVFAMKFLSIQRDYQVLHGEDVLQEMDIPLAVQWFLTEQEVRNQRMRLIRAYVLAGGKTRRYHQYLLRNTAHIIVGLSDLARCTGAEVPRDFGLRQSLLSETFDVDLSVIDELLQLKQRPLRINRQRMDHLHARLLMMFKSVIAWLEMKCPKTTL